VVERILKVLVLALRRGPELHVHVSSANRAASRTACTDVLRLLLRALQIAPARAGVGAERPMSAQTAAAARQD
jgi:hypothetical protein